MSDKLKASAESVMMNCVRGGLIVEETTAKTIANAITPAIAAFDAPALRLPMEEEPSGWTRRANPEPRR